MKRKMIELLKKAFALALAAAVIVSGVLPGTKPAVLSAQAIPVADAAMYRGTVTNQWEDDGLTYYELVQALGTNYGFSSLTVSADKTVYENNKLSDVKVGDYLEVYYGAGKNESLGTKAIISAGKLVNADFSVFNGTVEKIEKGSVLLKALDGNNEILFRYSSDTHLYLDIAKVKKGDRLNVYFNGITTRSIPAQANALEIRSYESVNIYRGNIAKVTTKGSVTTLNLVREAGTPFADKLTIQLNKQTITNLGKDKLKKGNYVEVLYETPAKKTSVPVAMTAKKLLDAKMVVYTGTLVEVKQDEKDAARGTLVMKDKINGEYLFHYGDATVFKTALNNLKAGDRLSIYYNGAATLSIPPQSGAYEVSVYKK